MRFNIGEEDVEAVKQSAIKEVELAVGKAKAKYIPNIAGQEMTYLSKKNDAEIYLKRRSLGERIELSDHPWIESESKIMNCEPSIAAETIMNKFAAWSIAAIKIEEIKRQFKFSIESAELIKEIYETKNQALSMLSSV